MQTLKKLQVKGFIIGMLTMFLLSGVTVFAASRTETINVTFSGIRLVVNGEQVTPRDGAGNVVEPFIWNGTTYLPVRAIANALDLEVGWDGNTQTVYLGAGATPPTTPQAPQTASTPLRQAAPFHQNHNAGWRDSVSMGNVEYRDVISFYHSISSFTLHNLNGQYGLLSGYLGRVDGSNMRHATITFIGDGVVLQNFELRAGNLPISISVPVEGVHLLRIEMQTGDGSFGRANYALYGFLE